LKQIVSSVNPKLRKHANIIILQTLNCIIGSTVTWVLLMSTPVDIRA